MRYLKKQVLNDTAPTDDRLAIDITNGIVMDTTNNLLLPKGLTGERPVTSLLGMIRYNTSNNEVEVFQGTSQGTGVWRALRYKESTQIVVQTLGPGDDVETTFGQLDPTPPSILETGALWSGANLIVLVENVMQVHNTNYQAVLNPPGRSGWYILFDTPVPLGKYITVLHNFDR